MSQIGHTLFTKTGDDHDQLKQKMLSVWKVLVEEYWKNEQHQVKVPVKSLHWSDYAISFHPQTYNSNIVECGIFHPIQGLFSTDSKRLPMHSFMGVPALSTHRLAKLEVCRASSWSFSLCLTMGWHQKDLDRLYELTSDSRQRVGKCRVAGFLRRQWAQYVWR